jgi:hypothetical protein
MSVFKKLQTARLRLSEANIKKSGRNSYGDRTFFYFELGDFMPMVNRLFDEIGLCGVFMILDDRASLTIYDVDADTSKGIMFNSPVVMAVNPKGQAIQSLGSTHSYLRRYLWLMALELCESCEIDGLPQENVIAPPTDYVNPPLKKEVPKAKLEESAKKIAEIKDKLVTDLPVKSPPFTDPIVKKTKHGSVSRWTLQVDAVDEVTWGETVVELVDYMLSLTKSGDDCREIYKQNIASFNKLKEMFPTIYSDILDKIKDRTAALTTKQE